MLQAIAAAVFAGLAIFSGLIGTQSLRDHFAYRDLNAATAADLEKFNANHETLSQNVKQPESVPTSSPDDVTASPRAVSKSISQGTVLGASTAEPLIVQNTGVTRDELDARIDGLTHSLLSSIGSSAHTETQPVYRSIGDVALQTTENFVPRMGGTLTNASVNGLAGLTDADLPDSLTASNYLPLSGGTLTGDLTMSGTLTAGSLSVAGISSSGALIGPYVTATSTTATSTFAGAVGIGTTSPRTLLSVAGASDDAVATFTNTNTQYGGYAALLGKGAVLRVNNIVAGTQVSDSLTIMGGYRPNENEGGWIRFGGKPNATTGAKVDVGIPAPSPFSPLTTPGAFQVYAADSNSYPILFSVTPGVTEGAGPSKVYIASKLGIASTSPYANLSITNTGTGPSFVVEDSTSPDTTPFLIDAGGNVGIGTASPLALTNIKGATDPLGGAYNTFGNLFIQSSEGSGAVNKGGTLAFGGDANSSVIPASFAKIHGFKENGTAGDASGYLAFETDSGTDNLLHERMRITSSGNVGVATTTPWAKLSVTNTGTGPSFIVEDTTSPDAAPFIIDASGNVGIGEPAPVSKLYVVGSASDPSLAWNSSGIANFSGIAGYTQLAISAQATSPYTISLQGKHASSGSTAFPLALNPLGGNVGIGTTSPWRTLSVTGTVGFDGLTGSTGAGSLCLDGNKQVVYNSASDNCLSSTRATKHAIEGLSLDGLRIIDALQPVSFVYNQGDGRTRYGFIAEDTAAVDGHLATYDASGTVSGIDDRSIIAILVAAIKQLTATVHGFADKFTTKELTFDRAQGDELTVDKLCVGSTCVTEEQFKAVFGDQSTPTEQTAASAPDGDSGAPTVAGDGLSTRQATSTLPTATSSSPAVLSPASDNEVLDTGLVEKPSASEVPPLPEPANDNQPAEDLPATGTE